MADATNPSQEEIDRVLAVLENYEAASVDGLECWNKSAGQAQEPVVSGKWLLGGLAICVAIAGSAAYLLVMLGGFLAR